jgi:hypothetical protein
VRRSAQRELDQAPSASHPSVRWGQNTLSKTRLAIEKWGQIRLTRGAFDLKPKKGFCFEETDNSKPLSFVSVTDDGIAYGTSLTKGSSLKGTTTPVQLSLATGAPKALPGVEQVPLADFDGAGAFTHDLGNVPYLVVYRDKG